MKHIMITLAVLLSASTLSTATQAAEEHLQAYPSYSIKPYTEFGILAETGEGKNVKEFFTGIGLDIEADENTFNLEARINADSEIRRLSIGVEHAWEITPSTWRNTSLHSIIGANFRELRSDGHPAYKKIRYIEPLGGFEIKRNNWRAKGLISHPTNTDVTGTSFDANTDYVAWEISAGITLSKNLTIGAFLGGLPFRNDGDKEVDFIDGGLRLIFHF